MPENLYLIDSNILIEAAKRYYAFPIAPSFWNALLHLAKKEKVASIDKVKEEIERQKDDLSAWIKQLPDNFFRSTNEEDVTNEFKKLVFGVQNNGNFKPEAISEFMEAADGWLISYAKCKHCILVTEERPNPYSRRKVKIPDVCKEFGVSYMNTFEMLKDAGVKLTYYTVKSI